jgi:hypothetical protein
MIAKAQPLTGPVREAPLEELVNAAPARNARCIRFQSW